MADPPIGGDLRNLSCQSDGSPARLTISVSALLAVAVDATVMWLALMLAIELNSRKKSGSGGGIGRDISSRLMGLIVLAMGVQFALTGLRAFFAIAPSP